MGFWGTAKSALTTALDHIEGRPTGKQYKLHPDSAYLGKKYHSKETPSLPISTRSLVPGKPSTPTSTFPPLPSLGSNHPAIEKGSHAGIMRPHVHIGKKSVKTPIHLPEAKYTVLRQGDLMDDDRIDSTVGRDRHLYWVAKGAVVLMIKERSEAEAVMAPSRKTREKGAAREEVDDVEGGDKSLLRSPSVEDFFADTFEVGHYAPIDTLPPNPLDKVPGASQPLNPLDTIPWDELVIIFRRDTKELLIRKQDGKLYPVLWKLRAIQSRVEEADDSSRVVGEVKFSSVEGEIDTEGYVNVDFA